VLGCPRCGSLDTGPVKESPHLRAIKSAFLLFCFATFFGGGLTCFKDKGPRPDAQRPALDDRKTPTQDEAEEVLRAKKGGGKE
jgi:predicted  nucleic acid-binding Zn-ribbon protein